MTTEPFPVSMNTSVIWLYCRWRVVIWDRNGMKQFQAWHGILPDIYHAAGRIAGISLNQPGKKIILGSGRIGGF